MEKTYSSYAVFVTRETQIEAITLEKTIPATALRFDQYPTSMSIHFDNEADLRRFHNVITKRLTEIQRAVPAAA